MNEISKNEHASGLRLWHALLIGILGGWFLVSQSSGHSNDAFAGLTTLQRLFQPGYLGLIAGQSIFTVGVALVCWIFARAFTASRNYAAHLAMFGTIVVFLAMLVGDYSLNKQKNNLIPKSEISYRPQSQVQTYAAAKVCNGYKIDPLKVLKVGRVVRLIGQTTGCLTLDSYEGLMKSINKSVTTGDTAQEVEIRKMHVCYNAPADGAVVRILQIVEVQGGCVMEVKLNDREDLPNTWTDVSMVAEVL